MLKRIKNILSTPLYQVAAILFIFEAVFVPSACHIYDVSAFINWAKYIFLHGIGNIYTIGNPDFNYPPLISYMLFLFGKFEGSPEKMEQYMRFLKLFALAADFISALLLVRLLDQDKKKSIVFLLLLVANPFFIYNSYCWGQVDGILAMFVFASFFSLIRKRLIWSCFFFTLAVNFKVHAIIFLPALGLLALYQYNKTLRIKDVAASLATIALTQVAILLPFIMDGQMSNVLKAIKGSVDYYDCISCNAFNIWAWLLPVDKLFTSDKQTWLNVSYKHWGTCMFVVVISLTLLPLLFATVSQFLKRQLYKPALQDLFLMFALVPLVFFFFNTQMHERFGHSTLIFTAAFAFCTRRYWLFLIVCLAYFANMENILAFFNFPNHGILLFNTYWGTSLYTVDLICLFYFLYSSFISQIKLNRQSLSQ